MKFSKTKRIKIKKYANAFYKANSQRFKTNPNFERCIKESPIAYLKWRCNTCDYKEDCSKGEIIWKENKNVIDELVDSILNIIESTDKKVHKR